MERPGRDLLRDPVIPWNSYKKQTGRNRKEEFIPHRYVAQDHKQFIALIENEYYKMYTLPRKAKDVSCVLNLSLTSKEIAFQNNQVVTFGKKLNYILLLLQANKGWFNFFF